MHLFTQTWVGGVSMVYQLTFYTMVVIAQEEGVKRILSATQRLLVIL